MLGIFTIQELKLLKMKRKNLDLTENCIKEIAKEAIDKGTDFKNLAQDILEVHAKTLIADRQKSEGKK